MKLDQLLERTGRKSPESGTRATDLESILKVMRTITTSLVLPEVLELVIDEALRITGAQRGFLMLANADRKLEFVVGRNAAGNPIPADHFKISSSVLEDVFTTGESLCVENALHDVRFERRQSVMDLQLNTIICSPLCTNDDTVGVIYVDSRYIRPVEKAEILDVFEILAGQAAIAIKNARLYQELKATYDELRLANRQIIESERMAMKGEIAGEISHELKNLVSVVVLNLQMLTFRMRDNSANEIGAIVDTIVNGVQKLQKFSQNLLTRSRAHAKLVPCDLNKLASDFAEFIRVLPKFRRTAISTRFKPSVPAIDLDIDQIQQVLLNLVNNAVEAFPEVSLEVATDLDADMGQVLLSVTDNGPGIDDTIRERLFREKVTTKVDGHGYGLPICRQILENHGGTIELDPTHISGASFVLRFPISATEAQQCHQELRLPEAV